jgi:TetR/AcrR family transcriptional regulator, transcriptional repressor for nem operon
MKTTGKTATRDKIIDSGMRAMLDKSFNAVGLNEILADAGVPKGSFYHYFKSKEAFGVAVVERFATKAADELRKILGDVSQSPLSRLRRWMVATQESLCVSGFRRH